MSMTDERILAMPTTEPIEIRFCSWANKDRRFQLLASASSNGVVHYSLHRIPQGKYGLHLTNLVGNTNAVLPMKAYENWQADVVNWLTTLSTDAGMDVYEVEEIL